MKFLLQLEYSIIPEWSEYYIDYKSLKNFLHKTLKTSQSIPSDKTSESLLPPFDDTESIASSVFELNINDTHSSPSPHLSSNEIKDLLNTFLTKYKEQVTKLTTFLNKKQNELEDEYSSLFNKITNTNYKLISYGNQFKVNERDEIGYASSWKRAISQIYVLTSWLHSYYSINTIGLKKIAKCANKIVTTQFGFAKINWLSTQIEQIGIQSSLGEQNVKICALRKKLQLLYSREFTRNNIRKATNELDDRLKQKKTKHTNLISFYCGIIIVNIVLFIMITLYGNTKNNNDDNDNMNSKSIFVFFPSFNFTFIIIELLFGVALNIYVFIKYRLNYLYVFDIEPKNRLGYIEILQISCSMFAMWTFLLLLSRLTLSFGMFNNMYSLFPILNLIFTLLLLTIPLHCSYFEFRKTIFIVLFRNFTPLYKNSVRFRDFVFGDILTSINKPLTSLVLSICLFSCSQCKQHNQRIDHCNRNTTMCLVVLVVPFFIRFLQCWNRYYFTKDAWPHLGNCLKYIGGMVNVIVGWLYATDKAYYLNSHVVVGLVATTYMSFWDYFMDWGLLRNKFLLRDNIVYKMKVYYVAMIVNFGLRYLWVTNLIGYVGINEELRNFILCVLEVFRRVQWGIFRVENECTNNPEKYREILEIPHLPVE